MRHKLPRVCMLFLPKNGSSSAAIINSDTPCSPRPSKRGPSAFWVLF